MLWGCYPDGPEYYSDFDLVYTNYDKNFNFSGHKNYFIPGKIVKITGNVSAGTAPEFVNSTYAVPILERIKSNMSALGYNLVTDSTQADFLLFASAIEVTNIGYYYDY